MEAKIKMEYQDTKTAKAITSAISPDNFKAPPGFLIKTTCKEEMVITNITSAMKISTFISTIDDLLFCISTAENVLKAVTKLKKVEHIQNQKIK